MGGMGAGMGMGMGGMGGMGGIGSQTFTANRIMTAGALGVYPGM